MSTEQGQIPHPISVAFARRLSTLPGLGRLEAPDGAATGVGQCGDSMDVMLGVRQGVLHKVCAVPHGCVYTKVCASAVCELAQGRTIEGALDIEPADLDTLLDGLPEDHQHCARLAVNTLGEAIENYWRKGGKTSIGD